MSGSEASDEGRRQRRIRIFQSYGRRDAAGFADRLRRDLEALGYDVWQDTERIQGGTAWDQEIRGALRDSDVVVAILSPHAMRMGAAADEDSTCLDEISYARFGRPPRPIVPVLALPCEIPLVIFRLDYVDFVGWEQEPERYGAAFGRLTQAVAAAAEGTLRYRRWDELLAPWDFSAFLEEKRRSFVGRDWLFAALDDWCRQASEPALLVTGDPGAGKSAVVAELVHRDPGGRILACYCCQADTPATLDPGRFVRSLAAMIASRLPDYARILERGAVSEMLASYACDADPASAFERAILAPLATIAPPAGPRLLVIDALDEAASARRSVGIVDLLAERLDRLPGWLRLVATTRRDPRVLDAFRGVRLLPLDGPAGEGRADVRRFVETALTGRDAADAAGRIAALSDGNFLFAAQTLQGLERGLIGVADLGALPPKVASLYRRFFERTVAGNLAESTALRILALLLAAREPLGEGQIGAILSADARGVRAALELLGGYVPRIEERCTLFHRSFAEWLGGQGPDRPALDTGAARKALTAWAARWAEHGDPYAFRHLPAHLAEAGDTDGLAALLADGAFHRAKADALADPAGLVEDSALLAETLWRAGRDDAVAAMAVADDPHRADGAAVMLSTAAEAGRVEDVLGRIVQASRHGRLPRRGRPSALAAANARQAVMRVAAARGLVGAAEAALTGGGKAAQRLIVPHLYALWRERRAESWAMLDRLSQRIVGPLGIVDVERLIVAGNIATAILAQHGGEPEVRARLASLCRRAVARVTGGAAFRIVSRPLASHMGMKALATVMAQQPDYQPLNLAELMAAWKHPPEARRDASVLAAHLVDQHRTVEEAIAPLLDRGRGFDVHLMLVAERVLVMHGARDPAATFAAIERVFHDGAPWFRQSVIYVGHHTLKRLESVPNGWLDRFRALVVAAVEANGGTFAGAAGTYAMVPHIACAEMLGERHSPAYVPRLIPRFLDAAAAAGDMDYARRVVRAAQCLGHAYRRHGLALAALSPALDMTQPAIVDAAVAALADLRMEAPATVEHFLARRGDAEITRRVRAVRPTIVAADYPSWIDDFVNERMLRSERFRRDLADAFVRAGATRSVRELLRVVTMSTFDWIAESAHPAE